MATAKITQKLDESLSRYAELGKQTKGFGLQNMEWNRRLALEKEMSRDPGAFRYLKIGYDESSNFLMFPAPTGIKVVAITSLWQIYLFSCRFTTWSPNKWSVKSAKAKMSGLWEWLCAELCPASPRNCRELLRQCNLCEASEFWVFDRVFLQRRGGSGEPESEVQ